MNEEPAYQRLVAQNGGALRRVAATYEADPSRQEDLLQEILLALWRALPTFRGESSERTFLFRIAHNRGLSHLLKTKRTPLVELEGLEEDVQEDLLADPRQNPERSAVERQDRARLLEAIRALPLLPRQILTLYLEGLSHREIGDVLGLTENHVAVQLHRARHKVRALLEGAAGARR
jgi:RNA polymerase sigma factor (sigma-70 family)